jgi:hypothetical protein
MATFCCSQILLTPTPKPPIMKLQSIQEVQQQSDIQSIYLVIPILLGSIFVCIVCILMVSPLCCCLICGVKPVLATLGLASFDPPKKQGGQVNNVEKSNDQPIINQQQMDQTLQQSQLPNAGQQQDTTQPTIGQTQPVVQTAQPNETTAVPDYTENRVDSAPQETIV